MHTAHQLMLSKRRQKMTLSHFIEADEWLLSFLSHDNGVLVVLREMPQLVVTVSFSPFSDACQKRKSWMRMRISSLGVDDGRRRRCQWPQP